MGTAAAVVVVAAWACWCVWVWVRRHVCALACGPHPPGGGTGLEVAGGATRGC